MPERKTKVIQMDEIPALIKHALPQGGKLLIAGNGYINRPNALVREVIRAGIRNLSVFAGPISANDLDMLVAVGAVKETFCPMVSALQFGLASNWRKAAESGAIVAQGIDEPGFLGGLMAADMGIPYLPLACYKSSDLAKVCPLLKRYTPPFGDEELYAIQAISPDLAIIHAKEADLFGNVRGPTDLEARASQRVLVSVERISSYEETLKEPWRTTLPGRYVDAVVEVPYGAHPGGCTDQYTPDVEHLREYWKVAGSNAQGDSREFQEYLSRYVLEPASIFDYLDRVGGLKRLRGLERKATSSRWNASTWTGAGLLEQV